MSAGQPPFDSPEIRRLAPVIGPGYTYGSVTDKISAIVLTRPTSLGWFVGFSIAFSLMGLMTVAIGWLMHAAWDLPHHLLNKPIWPYQPMSSLGCVIFDSLIAIWFFASAPALIRRGFRGPA